MDMGLLLLHEVDGMLFLCGLVKRNEQIMIKFNIGAPSIIDYNLLMTSTGSKA